MHIKIFSAVSPGGRHSSPTNKMLNNVCVIRIQVMIEITSANMRNYWFGRILVEIEVPDGACSGKDNGKLESESLLHGVAPLGSAAIVDTNLDSIEVDGTFDVLIRCVY